jgi:hypothetical protein
MKIRVFISKSSQDDEEFQRICALYLERQSVVRALGEIDRVVNATTQDANEIESDKSFNTRKRNLQEEVAKFDLEIANLKRRILYGTSPWKSKDREWVKEFIAKCSTSLIANPSLIQANNETQYIEVASKLRRELLDSVRMIANFKSETIADLMFACAQFYLNMANSGQSSLSQVTYSAAVADLHKALELYEPILIRIYKHGIRKDYMKVFAQVFKNFG